MKDRELQKPLLSLWILKEVGCRSWKVTLYRHIKHLFSLLLKREIYVHIYIICKNLALFIERIVLFIHLFILIFLLQKGVQGFFFIFILVFYFIFGFTLIALLFEAYFMDTDPNLNDTNLQYTPCTFNPISSWDAWLCGSVCLQMSSEVLA